MANIKSAKKRILVNKKKNEINKSRKSEIKTYVKIKVCITHKNLKMNYKK